MKGFERQQPHLESQRDDAPDTGVNKREVPMPGKSDEVPMPALNDMLEKMKINPDWVPPKPGEAGGDEETDDITPHTTVR